MDHDGAASGDGSYDPNQILPFGIRHAYRAVRSANDGMKVERRSLTTHTT
jgi:hypothetical protein